MNNKYYKVTQEAITNYEEADKLLHQLSQYIDGIEDIVGESENPNTKDYKIVRTLYNDVLRPGRMGGPRTKQRSSKANRPHVLTKEMINGMFEDEDIDEMVKEGILEEVELNPFQILQMEIFQNEGDILDMISHNRKGEAGSILDIFREAKDWLDREETDDRDTLDTLRWVMSNQDNLRNLSELSQQCGDINEILKD